MWLHLKFVGLFYSLLKYVATATWGFNMLSIWAKDSNEDNLKEELVRSLVIQIQLPLNLLLNSLSTICLYYHTSMYTMSFYRCLFSRRFSCNLAPSHIISDNLGRHCLQTTGPLRARQKWPNVVCSSRLMDVSVCPDPRDLTLRWRMGPVVTWSLYRVSCPRGRVTGRRD